MACVVTGSFGLKKKTLGAAKGRVIPECREGIGSLFVKDKRDVHTKSCEIQWINKTEQK